MAPPTSLSAAAQRVWEIDGLRLNIAQYAHTRTLSCLLRTSRASFRSAVAVLYHDAEEDQLVKCGLEWMSVERYAYLQQSVRRITKSSKGRTGMAPLLLHYPRLCFWTSHDGIYTLEWQCRGVNEFCDVRGTVVGPVISNCKDGDDDSDDGSSDDSDDSSDVSSDYDQHIVDLVVGILPPSGFARGIIPETWQPKWCKRDRRVVRSDAYMPFNFADWFERTLRGGIVERVDVSFTGMSIVDAAAFVAAACARHIPRITLLGTAKLDASFFAYVLLGMQASDIRQLTEFTCSIGTIHRYFLKREHRLFPEISPASGSTPPSALRRLRFVVCYSRHLMRPDDTSARVLARLDQLARYMFALGGNTCVYELDIEGDQIDPVIIFWLRSSFEEQIRILRNDGVIIKGWRKLKENERV